MGGYGGFGDQAQLLKTDASLNMQWSRVYSWDGAATVGSRSGRETSDGGYIFTGKRQFTGTILMKTNVAGFIPCKNPGLLTEIIPSILVQARNPSVATGINAANFPLNTLTALVDTVTTCSLATTTMPIELISFVVQPLGSGKVLLKWSTATETNNDRFIAERSADGKNFCLIGSVKGAGTSSEILDYSFTDYSPLADAVSYYRIRQVDYDGSSTVSEIVPVVFKKNEFEFFGVFNIENKIDVYFFCSVSEVVQYSVTDMLGSIISLGIIASKDGVNHLTLDTVKFSNGIYFLSLSNGKKIITKMFNY
jgi:hypothetical protein